MTLFPSRRTLFTTALAGSAASCLAGAAWAVEASEPDPETQALLTVLKAPGRKPLFRQTVAEARRTLEMDADLLSDRPLEIGSVEDTSVFRRGGDIPIRVYTPSDIGADEALPIVVFVHGGWFVAGSLDTHDDLARRICEAARAKVVSVDYRLAPEHPFPMAIEDCVETVDWVSRNSGLIKGDPNRIALVGESTGATLAIATALRIARMGGTRIAAQALLYPLLDLGPETTFPSRRRFGTGAYGLSLADLVWMKDHYVKDDADATESLISPLRAKTFAGLPNTLVVTAGFDPLRDEGGFLVRRMREEGVLASERHFDTTIHGFMMYPQLLSAARGAIDAVGLHLQGVLRR